MIKRILIANRGEIARRIIRTAKSMDISTFAIYTNDEKNALHVQEADKAISLGNGALTDTYLNIPLIIKVALENSCDAIHPGYGFLSENADFAEACRKSGIVFIGPESEVIRLMGDKINARNFIENINIPLPPSATGSSYQEIRSVAAKLQYPLIIKASAGGGGKGMKIVTDPSFLEDDFESASREALNYFGDSTVYLEQYLENARHIEVQILGDVHGNTVHLFERECSVQRRHQKIIEEAPSPSLSPEVRSKLLDTALNIARALNYTSAGTIEFLFDDRLNFYFLEMNTRIQVEHPVTELITGVDIVREQINIANGEALTINQESITAKGHAIECRVYAEDPGSGFMPSPGFMLLNHLPVSSGVRIDSAFHEPTFVSPNFDPLLAKITAHSNNRSETIKILTSYLKKCAIHGLRTNLDFLAEILTDSDFTGNRISTRYCELKSPDLNSRLQQRKIEISQQLLIAFAVANNFKDAKNRSVWQSIGPWRIYNKRIYEMEGSLFEVYLKRIGSGSMVLTIGGTDYLIKSVENQEPLITFLLDNEKYTGIVTETNDGEVYISFQGMNFLIFRKDLPDTRMFSQIHKPSARLNGNHVLSPLNGKVVKVSVKEGDTVEKGELMMIIESMKMENKILAPAQAEVTEVLVGDGDQVTGSELLIKLKMLN